MGIVTADISVTLDGYGAGPNQRFEAPFGDIDEDHLHSWMFAHADESPAEIAAITDGSAYIAIAGGATTINQYLAAGLLDELRLHFVPFAAGVSSGSRMFDGVPPTAFDVVAARHTPHVTHLTYRRAGLGL